MDQIRRVAKFHLRFWCYETGYRCCVSIYLVWTDYKRLGYRGLETVVVTREEVNMMIRGYRYLVYRGVVNVIDKAGGECDGGW